MADEVRCPNPDCGHVSRLGVDGLGRVFRCPRCMARLPEATGEAEPARTAGDEGPSVAARWDRPPGQPAATSRAELIAWPGSAPASWRGLAVRPAECAEPADEIIRPLLGHCGQMQQQMFDQFRQVVMMMFQMFGTLHQEQVGLLREELDHIRRLTGELHELRAQLGQRPPAADGPHPRRRREPAPPAQTNPPTRPDRVAEQGRQVTAPSSPRGPAGEHERAAPRNEETATRRAGGPTDASLHGLLCQRIAALEREQQGRWRRVLASVMSRPPGRQGP
jgi:hypothetical protein